MLKIDCNNQKWLDCAYHDNRKLTNGPKTKKFLSKPSCCFKSVYICITQSQKDIWEDYELKKTCLRVN